MLVKINYQDKKMSIYKCDMCNEEIKINNCVKILSQRAKNGKTKKEYDLCINCFNKIKKSIIKYNKKILEK